MQELTVPDEGRNIFLEINGVRLATVERCVCTAKREVYPVEAIDDVEPRGLQPGSVRYTLELHRVCSEDGVAFYDLSDFSVVICKPDRQIIYTGCEWSAITETVDREDVDRIDLTATHRMEMRVI